jgi:hypothetical protein
MPIEQGILQLLGSNAALQALVPNDVSGTMQVYWLLAPKGAKPPYIILNRVPSGNPTVYSMQGPTGEREALFQVDCYTDSKAGTTSGFYTCVAIADAVRSVLEPFIGNLPDTNSTAVGGVFTENEFPLPYEEGATGFVFRYLLIFKVFYYVTALEIPEVVIANGF